MARFSSFSLPRLLYSAVRSSTSSPSPSSSLLASTFNLRHFSNESVKKLRNVWISGLINPNKATLTDRHNLYSYRNYKVPDDIDREETKNSSLGINKILHSVITFLTVRPFDITFVDRVKTKNSSSCIVYNPFFNSKPYDITVIDTSNHVDFTVVDVQRTLCQIDSAVLVLSCDRSVQTESIIIDQQITRFQLPRIIFIKNLSKENACPSLVVDEVKSKLHHHCAAIQVPIGIGDSFSGIVDLVKLRAFFYHEKDHVLEQHAGEEVPFYMLDFVLKKRRELIETVSEVDDELAEAFRSGNNISVSELDDAICRATLAKKFVPIFLGSRREKIYMGLKLLLDGVINYLPSPIDVSNYALDQNGEKVELSGSIDGPLVALAFTMEHRRLCKLTYLRIYQGVVRKGDYITNVNTGERIKIRRLFRRHKMGIEDVHEAHAGEIVAVLDFNCASGDTFTDGSVRYTMPSLNVPACSVSEESAGKFSNALNESNDPIRLF